ncbi:MAG: hypothetical protein GKR88_17515 [Flavobacteriaceae bacterium]|nr:MAG: hypothetical protein GKR88_17515 [Flavobacteriaceae bacterium]
MEKLKEANLYLSKLIPVSGKLVERYNACLLKLGFTKTKLKSFSIDGMGWSPEIAEEKKNTHYLNNGEANPHCIIISPLQRELPIYMPFHSFDKELMKQIFKIHGDKINDITRDAAICVDFDQKIDVFYEVWDIIKYKEIVISFRLMNDLDKAKEEQSELIAYFHKENNFIDEVIHWKLLESGKKYGDLRNRNLNMEEIHYPLESFYTKAFGGVYMLRNIVLPVLIFEDDTHYDEALKSKTGDVLMYHISDAELIEKLQSYSLIELDLEEELMKKRYPRIKKYMFSEYLTKTNHLVKDILEDRMLFKSYLNKIDIDARKKVMSVELYLEKKKSGMFIKPDEVIDKEMLHALYKPHSSLQPDYQDLIWKLLVNIAPKDILFMYWYDKEEFYKQFKTWNTSMKDWAVEVIRNHI